MVVRPPGLVPVHSTGKKNRRSYTKLLARLRSDFAVLQRQRENVRAETLKGRKASC